MSPLPQAVRRLSPHKVQPALPAGTIPQKRLRRPVQSTAFWPPCAKPAQRPSSAQQLKPNKYERHEPAVECPQRVFFWPGFLFASAAASRAKKRPREAREGVGLIER